MAKKRRRNRDDEPETFWNSFLFKFSSKVFLGLIIIVVFLSISQCTVKKPESPSWNTNFVLPVVNHTYDMEELLSKVDQDEIYMDSTGAISITIIEDIDPVGISSEDFTTPDISFYDNQILGEVEINTPTVAPVSMNLSLISGLATSFPGDSAIVPSDSFSVFNALPPISEFSQVTVSNGYMIAYVNNNLGIDLSWTRITIFDLTSYSPVATDSIVTSIADGTADSIMIPLIGKTFSNDLRMDIVCGTPGGTVYNYSIKNISTGIIFSNPFEVSSGMAQVPSLPDKTINQKLGLNLDSGESINNASISSGNISFVITNNTALESNVNITVPNLLSGGIPYAETRLIPANSVINISNDLSGYEMSPDNDSVDIDFVASLPGSGGIFVDFDRTDDISVDVVIENLSFNSISGVFSDNSAAINESVSDLNVPEGFDEIGFVTAILTLEIENGIDLPGILSCTLSADNGQSLILSGNIDARGTETTRLSTIVNNDIGDFLSPLPNSITLAGEITFGDNQVHTITVGDSVSAKVTLDAPMYVKVNNAEITDLDIEKSELNQDDMEIITDHLIEARFVYDITSHLPLGFTAVIHMSGDSTSLYDTPQLSLDTILCAPAPVSLTTGITTGEIISSGEIYLDSADIQILKNDSLFIRHELFLNGSDTAGVLITGSDYITVSGWIEVEYHFDGDF